MNKKMIEICQLTKSYQSNIAVNHLDLNIKEGEVFGLLGPNGAGKSTTIRMILGMTEPDSGSILVNGVSSSFSPIEVKQFVGYLPEEVGFYKNMSGYENLMYTAKLNRISPSEANQKVHKLLNMVGLEAEKNKKVGAYSRGMKQRLGLADVLIKDPKVVILDEPTLGLDPEGMKELLRIIKNLSKEQGITVLFSSHHLQQVQQICDRIGLFVKGNLIACGNLQELRHQIFSENLVNIECDIDYPSGADINGLSKSIEKSILQLEDVSEVKVDKNHCLVKCESDIASKISRKIMEFDLGITTLRKKEFGIDEIYHRYFEMDNQ